MFSKNESRKKFIFITWNLRKCAEFGLRDLILESHSQSLHSHHVIWHVPQIHDIEHIFEAVRFKYKVYFCNHILQFSENTCLYVSEWKILAIRFIRNITCSNTQNHVYGARKNPKIIILMYLVRRATIGNIKTSFCNRYSTYFVRKCVQWVLHIEHHNRAIIHTLHTKSICSRPLVLSHNPHHWTNKLSCE